MALKRGLAAVRDAKTQNEQRGGGNNNRFFLRENETALLRFWGDFENGEAPALASQHYIKRLGGATAYQNCGDNSDTPCVYCHMISVVKDKGVGYAQQKAYFDIKDYRKFHKLENKIRVLKSGYMPIPGRAPGNEDYIETQYPPCTATKQRPCEFCRTGNPATVQGFRHWDIATSWADVLVAKQAYLRTFCLCGAVATEDDGSKVGTIFAKRYLCGNAKCGKPVKFDPSKSVASCSVCRQTHIPIEEIDCTACHKPRRADLQDFLFKVKQTGEGKKKTISFDEILPVRPPTAEEIEEYNKHKTDFEKLCVALAPEQQSALLGLPASPFQTAGHGARQYGTGTIEEDTGEVYEEGEVSDGADVPIESLFESSDEEIPFEAPPSLAPTPAPRKFTAFKRR